MKDFSEHTCVRSQNGPFQYFLATYMGYHGLEPAQNRLKPFFEHLKGWEQLWKKSCFTHF